MLPPVLLRVVTIAASAGLFGADAAALSMGELQGQAWLGRPLELRVPLQLEPGEAPVPCASADLHYGERRVLRSPGLAWQPTGERDILLRIVSMQPVDEARVRLELRVGCGEAVVRRYQLVAQAPTPARAAAAVLPQAHSVSRAAPVEGAPARTPAPPADAAGAASPLPAAPPLAAAPLPPAAAATPTSRLRVVQALRPPAPKRAPPADRLRLGPAGFQAAIASEPVPGLRLARSLQLQPAAFAQGEPLSRAAAAALWQALQHPPEEVAVDRLRLAVLDRELQAARGQVQDAEQGLADMRAEVMHARSARAQLAKLNGLLALLLAVALGAVIWQWRLRATGAVGWRWPWHGRRGQAQALRAPAPSEAGQPTLPPQTQPGASSNRLSAAGPAHSRRGKARAPQGGQGGALRLVGVQELLDVHDQAEFFVSTNQPEQAVEVLENHVHDQVETSALAWLDLLALYHARAQEVEYEQLRVAFQERFAAELPGFERFDPTGRPLESYSRALGRIVALWPDRQVLRVIEEALFRKPGVQGAETFSLQAYRDLVLLYYVALAVASDQSLGVELPSGASSFGAMSLPEEKKPAASEAARDPLRVPPSARIGIDIELAAPAAGELPALELEPASGTGR